MDIAGLTNAMTDVLIEVTDEDIETWGLQKGVYSKPNISKDEFYEQIAYKKYKLVAGGSPANVMHNAAKLGLKTALFGTTGYDYFGTNYLKELRKAGIESYFNVARGRSGLCYIMVTPDREKTTVADIGVAGQYGFCLEALKQTRMFHTSGYELLTNPARVVEAVQYAKSIGAKVSYDLAAPEAVERQSCLEKVLQCTDIVFATEEEAMVFCGNPVKALNCLSGMCEVAVLKKGKKGSTVKKGNELYEQQIVEAEVVNTNGAGDAYAAGFLNAYLKSGGDARYSAAMGSYVASLVVSMEKSHL